MSRTGHDNSQLALFAAALPEPGVPADAVAAPADSPRAALLAADRETRRLAQTEFSTPLLVEAGAGTGKTTTLTARIVAWCLGPGWDRAAAGGSDAEVAAEALGGVVAITFTEAAAAEMARRVGDTLRQIAAGSRPDWLVPSTLPTAEQARRAKALVGTLDHLVVRTIHAFCRGLLAAHPLEAGVHPELQVDADGTALETVAREVVEGVLARGYGDPGDPDLLLLARRGHGPSALVEALVTLGQAALPADALDDDPFASERTLGPVAELAAALADFARLALGRLEAAAKKTPTVGHVLAALARTLERVPAGGELPAPVLLEVLRAEWDDKALARLDEWGKGKFTGSERDAAGDRAAELAAAARALADRLEPWLDLDLELFSAARRALSPLHAELRTELARRGVATFEDLLVGARDLVRERPEVVRRVRSRITQLLVDEFQDTDAVQCDLVATLALGGAPAERPGLFVVGDPKQSIYGWRNADLAAYDAFRDRLVAAGGRVLPLLENFRSVPAILDEVAATMAPTMLAEPGLQPAFAPLVACERLAGEPGFRAGGRAPVEHWVTAVAPAANSRPADAVRLEAEAVARDAARLHGEGVAWRDMALLLRGFGDLDEYLEAFRRAGVPFSVAGDRQYFRRREVIDAAALLRAVVDPGDQLALLAVLRAPFVGVPDAALLPLWRVGFPRLLTELTEPRPELLARLDETIASAATEVHGLAPAIPGLADLGSWELVLGSTVAALAELRRDFATLPADRFLDRLRALVPLEATAAARYLGRYRLANLNRFFRRVGEALEAAEGDVGALLRALRRGVNEALEEEEGRPLAEEDAFQVMTVHRAKGLDFGHVYLGQLHKLPPPDNPPPVVVGRGTERLELRLFGQASPGFAACQLLRKRVEARERVRLLYVAMTRAKDRLVLAGSWEKVAPAADVDQVKSSLQLVASRFPFEPNLGALAAGADGAGRLEAEGFHWYFPAADESPSAEPPGAGPAETEARPALPPAAEAERRAEARAARPLGEAISAEAHRRLEELIEARPAALAEKGGTASREVGMAIGTAVHRVFEELDPGATRPFDAGRQRLDAHLESLELDDETRRRAKAGALDLLARAEAGPFLGRLAGLEILARELPVVAPAPESEDGALLFRTGSIDLLARDPATGELVVVDYKTDSEEDLDARARAYAPQLEAYARAVAENFSGTPVRAELWFLAAGVVLPGSGTAE